MRKDVFDAIVNCQKRQTGKLDADQTRYVERLIKLGKRNGTVTALAVVLG
jgi:hypothetical protein